MESAHTWDGTGCEFDSWQCWIYIISHAQRAYDYLGSFGVLWVHIYGLIQKLCLKKYLDNLIIQHCHLAQPCFEKVMLSCREQMTRYSHHHHHVPGRHRMRLTMMLRMLFFLQIHLHCHKSVNFVFNPDILVARRI